MEEKILESLKSSPKTFHELKDELDLNEMGDGKVLNNALLSLSKERKIYFKKGIEKYFIKDEEVLIGTYKPTRKDYGFVECDGSDVFIPAKFVGRASAGDKVKVVLFPKNPELDKDRKNRSGKIVSILSDKN